MVLAVVVGLLVSVVSPAGAHIQTILDADDTPGPLDVVATRLQHFFVAETHPERHWAVIQFRLITYETWNSDRLAGIDNHITFEFDLNGDKGVDRCLEIRQGEDGGLKAQMFTAGCQFLIGEPVGRSRRVLRPDDHSLKVQIRKRALGKGVNRFRWRAVTSYDEDADAECPRPDPMPPERRYGTCTDFTRWVRHRV